MDGSNEQINRESSGVDRTNEQRWNEMQPGARQFDAELLNEAERRIAAGEASRRPAGPEQPRGSAPDAKEGEVPLKDVAGLNASLGAGEETIDTAALEDRLQGVLRGTGDFDPSRDTEDLGNIM
jgi:hypothetical protein